MDANDVYTYCGLIIPFGANTLLTKVYLKFLLTKNVVVIVSNEFDCCKYTDNSSHFCKSCYCIIAEKKIL